MVQVFIVEDHPIIRQSYALILQRETDITICGEADSGEAALLQIPHVAPDIVLVDFSLPGMNGLEFVQHLRKEHPTLATIVISGHKEETFIEEILAAGATDYIVKEQAPQSLLATIRRIMPT
ncbi:MAG: DNA-binding response regulator [Caldilinea sp. CFX5]|nr:DNA-binding response regulator [Caldilinea sp. CFX5]